MVISENKMQIVIDNYFKSECDINTSIRSAFEKGFRIGVKKASSAQPDDGRLERCRFEYLNACKIVAHPTKDTSKSDIYDAHAVIKALHPIFGDVEF